MNWKTIFNPFERFDDKLLLAVGLLGTALIVLLGYYWTGNCFISIYRISRPDRATFEAIAIPTFISFASAIVILFILGRILNNKTRLIDIVNTVLLSQLVVSVMQVMDKIPLIKNSQTKMISQRAHPAEVLPIWDLTVTIGIATVSLIIMIYSITLYYNGFKTATNIKKWQHITVFAAVSLLTTMICQILISKYY